jgi:glycoprotein-N-acetylgalactosamine 3-beta-galactosyltransferase
MARREMSTRLRWLWLRVMSDRTSVFLVGFLLGVVLALLTHYTKSSAVAARAAADIEHPLREYDFAYEKWLEIRGMQRSSLDPDRGRYNMSAEEKEKVVEAAYLRKRIHVTCLVFPDSVDGAKTVRETWGAHCNELRQYSHKLKNVTYGLDKMALKSSFSLLCGALHKIRDEIPSDLQWLLVSSDNAYVLVENLRFFIAPLNSSDAHYLGHPMRFWAQIYNWGDAGYVLSRAAIDRLLDEKFPTVKSCAAGGKFWKNSDWHLGKHLAAMDIKPVDTRDHLGRGRFNGYTFKIMLIPGAISMFDRYWRDSLYLSPDGPKCCSNYAVTFHGIVSHSKVYQLDYLFQRLRPFYAGGTLGNRPPKVGSEKAVPGGLRETFLTLEEMLKDKYLAKAFHSLMTTEKSDFDRPEIDDDGV